MHANIPPPRITTWTNYFLLQFVGQKMPNSEPRPNTPPGGFIKLCHGVKMALKNVLTKKWSGRMF